DAVRRVIAYANGIPRLINVLCDGALLIAYSTDSRAVTGRMVDEVATDLGLTPRQAQPASFPAPPAPAARPPRAERRAPARRRVAWGAVTVLAALVLALGWSLVALSPVGERLSLLRDRLSSLGAAIDRLLGTATDARPSTAARPGGGVASGPPATGPAREAGDRGPSRASVRLPSPAEASPPAGSSAGGHQAPAPAGPPASGPAAAPAAGLPAAPGAPAASPPLDSGEAAPALPDRAGRTVVIPRGATVSGLVFEHYGGYSPLALDLIQEMNPWISDVDVVLAGRSLWLPALAPGTLIRRQPDGSYRLLLASLPGAAAAAQLALQVRRQGYEVSVTPREVASQHWLYRVEILGLRTRDDAARAWDVARSRGWFAVRDGAPAPPPSPLVRENAR